MLYVIVGIDVEGAQEIPLVFGFYENEEEAHVALDQALKLFGGSWMVQELRRLAVP